MFGSVILSQMPVKSCRLVMESDGTEVDEEQFFQQLEPHTVLVLLDTGQTWSGSE